jgi:Fe-S cluster biogenesis protein NfuA
VLVALSEAVVRALREVVAPLIEADGGELYLVEGSSERLRLHVSGACSGCPGFFTTRSVIIEPALKAAGFSGDVDVASGWLVPPSAERVLAGC